MLKQDTKPRFTSYFLLIRQIFNLQKMQQNIKNLNYIASLPRDIKALNLFTKTYMALDLICKFMANCSLY